MTAKRRDDKSTPFGLWLREQPEIDSYKYKFRSTNVDYIWVDEATDDWMIIEEKCRNAKVRPYQRKIFHKLHKVSKTDPKYKGIYLLSFERTSPDDGKMWLNKKEINKEQLIKFLRFETL